MFIVLRQRRLERLRDDFMAEVGERTCKTHGNINLTIQSGYECVLLYGFLDMVCVLSDVTSARATTASNLLKSHNLGRS
jgi:hypothetical protein